MENKESTVREMQGILKMQVKEDKSCSGRSNQSNLEQEEEVLREGYPQENHETEYVMYLDILRGQLSLVGYFENKLMMGS